MERLQKRSLSGEKGKLLLIGIPTNKDKRNDRNRKSLFGNHSSNNGFR